VGGESPSVPQSESELLEFFDLALDLMVIAGFDGYFKRVNPAYERTLGYPLPELLSRPLLETIHPEDLPWVRDKVGELVAGDTNDVIGVEHRVICGDGSVRWLEWNSRTMPERGVIFAVGRDVTDRRRADAELREAQGMVEASRDELARIAEEQAALRRVATLVARGTPPEEVFAAVANEVARLLSADLANVCRYESDGTLTFVASASKRFPVGSRWPIGGQRNLATLVSETGRPARLDNYADATGPLAAGIREEGIRSAVGTPIIVEGRLWGLMSAGSRRQQPLPPDTEARLASFTELAATAIANTQARAEVERLVDEQAALRRVATLVAEGAAPSDVFAAVTEEVARLFLADLATMCRYEPGGTYTVVASAGTPFPVGSRWPIGGKNLATLVFETGRPARIEDYAEGSGPLADGVRAVGVRSAVGTPITVEDRLWGATAVATSREQPLPADTEERLAALMELVATAIANTESRATANRLTEEQFALRRVATLVAKEAPPAEVFAKVAEELANVIGDVDCSLFRDEGDGTASVVALSGARVSGGLSVGSRLPADGDGVIASVLREGRPCRIGDYSAPAGAIAKRGRELGIRSAVACPIVVGGRQWGAMGAGGYQAEAFPPEAETLLGQFADLVATAIGNADARAEAERLAEEQAALRRVATLVAAGAPPELAFAAVANEVRRLFLVELVNMCRYESDRTFTVVAGTGAPAVGSRWPLVGKNVTTLVFETGRSVRIDSYAGATGPAADEMHQLGVRREGMRSAVGTPVIVEGKLWGMLGVGTTLEQPLPTDTEARLASFTELVATAIANTEARTEVAASRARIVAATDEERRRVVRDLHDGAQQRLVTTIVTLKLAHRALHNEELDLPVLLTEALDHAQQATAELRELAHGILPGVLTHGGLRAGVGALASRMPVPVEIDVSVGRLPTAVEATAYFVVAEALTNVVKHARAGHAEVTVLIEDGTVQVQVRDDGVGGARREGSGLIGLADRLAALDGELRVESPADSGTLVAAAIPLPD
jgi:PAS domain S-box-containing protein